MKHVLFAIASRAGIAALLFLGSSQVANAQFVDGNKLLSYLREWQKAQRGASDVSYMDVGMYDGYVVAIADSPDVESCVPDGATMRQIGAVVEKYLNDHPAEWNKPAAGAGPDCASASFLQIGHKPPDRYGK